MANPTIDNPSTYDLEPNNLYWILLEEKGIRLTLIAEYIEEPPHNTRFRELGDPMDRGDTTYSIGSVSKAQKLEDKPDWFKRGEEDG